MFFNTLENDLIKIKSKLKAKNKGKFKIIKNKICRCDGLKHIMSPIIRFSH